MSPHTTALGRDHPERPARARVGLPRRRRGLVFSPDEDALRAARVAVRYHLLAFQAAKEGARAGEIEPTHQLRVATRRLRATLGLFAPLLAKSFVETAHRDLTWLGRAVGNTRDLDVLFAAVKARAHRLDPGLREALGPLGLAIRERRAQALAALVATLETPRYHRLLQRLTTFLDSPAARRRPRRLADVAPELVRPLVRAVRRSGRGLGPDAEPPRFHRLRKRVKRLRYALETLASVGGRRTRRLLARLEVLQETLGEGQDAATQIAWLRAWARTPGVPTESLLPVGALIQLLARRGEKCRRRGLRRWRRTEGAGLLDCALDDLVEGTRRVSPAGEQVTTA